ncbi:hypothetical protein NDU88_004375, partial [Pleurodeles waltl]
IKCLSSTEYLVSGGKSPQRATGEEMRGKRGVCVVFRSAHTDLRRSFPRGEVGRRFPARRQSLFVDREDYQMSRVCAWILLLIFRLRVVLRGCASKFRSHGRRRVDFSLEVGRCCPCEAVRRNFGLTAGVASISPWKSGGV